MVLKKIILLIIFIVFCFVPYQNIPAEKEPSQEVIKPVIVNIKPTTILKLKIANVRITWYNPEDPRQTDDTPNICAWGHKLKPFEKVVAVSRDFLNEGILGYGDIIVIDDCHYTVKDKMNKRYSNSIDIAITDSGFPNTKTIYQRRKIAYQNGIQFKQITVIKS